MLLPSATQRSDDLVGIAMPTVPVRSPLLPTGSDVVERPQPALVSAATTASAAATRTMPLRMKSSDLVLPRTAVTQSDRHHVSANILDLVTRLTPLSRPNVSANNWLTDRKCER
jgi:hypothetical protein